MDISERRVGDVTVLTLAGRLVLDDGDVTLRERIDALIAEGRIDVVLNVHDITYIDSCGIGALVGTCMSLRRRGGNLTLVCPSERCRRVLTITHLVSVFDAYESEDAAVRSFAASSDAQRDRDSVLS